MLRQTHGYFTSKHCPLSDKIRSINRISLPKFPVLIYKRFVANSVTIHRASRNLATEAADPAALLLNKLLNGDCHNPAFERASPLSCRCSLLLFLKASSFNGESVGPLAVLAAGLTICSAPEETIFQNDVDRSDAIPPINFFPLLVAPSVV